MSIQLRWSKLFYSPRSVATQRTRQRARWAFTWTGGRAGTRLDALALAGGASVQGGGVSAAPTPLLPAAAAHGAARRPRGPRGPPAIHCSNRASQGYPTSNTFHPALHHLMRKRTSGLIKFSSHAHVRLPLALTRGLEFGLS